MSERTSCPSCTSDDLRVFHRAKGVPVNSCLSLSTREEALAFPRGDISLAFCQSCGFIFNAAFDESLLEYSERYDPTQAFSGTFNRWHLKLAESLVEQYGLRGKRIIEIGCGKGEFLTMLCELGANSGIGFDPAVDPERTRAPKEGDAKFVQDFYSEKYADEKGDFVCCKMTLEHIPEVASFVGMLRGSIGERPDAIVFVQVPEVGLILQQGQFYDVMHEHCSYFTTTSLRRLFAAQGFEVIATPIQYQGQHLSLEARPGRPRLLKEPLDELRELCRSFADRCAERADRWAKTIGRALDAGQRIVLWGSGSKATAFLNALGIESEIDGVVDINPNRRGMYLATCGQEIIAPDRLPERPPGLVIAVNPIYREEIRRQLADMGLAPELLTLSP